MDIAQKNQRGITLIALIITIITLVILAAISIKAVTEINIIEIIANSTTNYAKKQEEEKIELDKTANFINETINGRDKESSGSEDEKPEKPEEPKQITSEELGYVTNNLMLHYDGIINSGTAHNSSVTTWKDLSGNNRDGTLNGCTWRRK